MFCRYEKLAEGWHSATDVLEQCYFVLKRKWSAGKRANPLGNRCFFTVIFRYILYRAQSTLAWRTSNLRPCLAWQQRSKKQHTAHEHGRNSWQKLHAVKNGTACWYYYKKRDFWRISPKNENESFSQNNWKKVLKWEFLRQNASLHHIFELSEPVGQQLVASQK